MDSNLISFAINILSDVSTSGVKSITSPKVEQEIDSAFHAALRKFCPNLSIREKEERGIYNLAIKLTKLPEPKARQKLLSSHYVNFFSYFELEIATRQYAFNYLKELRDERRYLDLLERTDKTLDQVQHFYKNIQIRLQNQTDQYLENDYPKQLTSQVFTRNHSTLFGRIKELKHLRKTLHHDQQPIVLSGIGGVGKTSLVQAYLEANWNQYAHIAWINCKNGIPEGVVNTPGLLSSLRIKSNDTIRRLFERVMSKFSSIEKKAPSFLILDDVNDLDEFISYLPKQPNWHIIITSRRQFNSVESFYLDFLSPEDAFKLFNSICKNHTLSKVDLDNLLKKLDYHTLTIEVLAKSVSRRSYKANDLLNALDRDLKVNVKTYHSESEQIDRIMSYLCSIFTMEKLEQKEIETLKKFLCLPIIFHNSQYISSIWHPESQEDRHNLLDSIYSLWEKGWLISNDERSSFLLHTVVYEVICRLQTCHFEDISHYLDWVNKELSFNYEVEGKSRYESVEMLPFGISVNQLIENKFPYLKNEANAKIEHFWNQLALAYQTAGLFQKGYSIMKLAYERSLQHNGKEHPTTLTRTKNFTSFLSDLGRYIDAKNLLEDFLPYVDSRVLKFPKEASSFYSDYGDTLMRVKKYVDAEVYLRKSIEIAEKEYSKDSSSLANKYSNLALVLRKKNGGVFEGHFDFAIHQEAKELLIKSIQIVKKRFGRGHPFATVKLGNLAMIYSTERKYDEAKRILLEVISHDENNFGEDHPRVLLNYNNLATIYYSNNEFELAQKTAQKLLALDLRKFGEHHPNTALSYKNLANILESMLDYEEAATIYSKAIESYEKITPIDFRRIIDLIENLSNTIKHTLYTEKILECKKTAKKLYNIIEKVIYGYQELLDTDNEINILCSLYDHKSVICGIMKDYTEQKESILVLLSIRERYTNFPVFDHLVCDLLFELAYANFNLKNYVEVIDVLVTREKLNDESDYYPPASLIFSQSSYLLAKSFFLEHDLKSAKKICA